jgi:hypothetical protein
MNRLQLAGLVVALSTGMFTSDASGQASIFVMGGLSVPTGDYGEIANAGWLAQAGVGIPVGAAGVTLGASGLYGVNNHEPPPDGDKTNLYGGLAFLQYTIGEATAVAPYVYGGVGFLTHSYKSETFTEESTSGLAGTVGGGVNIPLGGTIGFVEGEYLTGFGDIDGTDLFVVSAGIVFEVGG